jgi:hypothetical protein
LGLPEANIEGTPVIRDTLVNFLYDSHFLSCRTIKIVSEAE